MKKFLLKALGIICVFLGTLGIFLPILPTTPFLLLASWAFIKSSDTLYEWLMNHKVLGLYIRSYIKYRGVSRTHKIMAIITLWFTMSLSIYLINKNTIKYLLVFIGFCVTIHILKLRTLSIKEMKELEEIRTEFKEKKSIENRN